MTANINIFNFIQNSIVNNDFDGDIINNTTTSIATTSIATTSIATTSNNINNDILFNTLQDIKSLMLMIENNNKDNKLFVKERILHTINLNNDDINFADLEGDISEWDTSNLVNLDNIFNYDKQGGSL